MSIAVFSDLHLKRTERERQRHFAELLRKLHREGCQDVWILGDIFDLMVGSFGFWRQEFKDVFDAFEDLSKKGARVLWLEGNHDFEIKSLLEPLGIEVFDGVVVRQLGQLQVYLAHGDLVNTEDLPYLKWRAATRSQRMKLALRLTPGWIMKSTVLPFAEWLSDQSRQRVRDSESQVRSRYRAFAEQKWSEGFQAVFLGHCHVEDFFQNEAGSFYCNVGGPIGDQVNALRYCLWNPSLERFPKMLISEKMNS